MYVWLWFADNWCGVTSSKAKAQEFAEAHMPAKSVVLVEYARVTLGLGFGATLHTRTRRYTGTLICGRTRWTETDIQAESLAEAS